jgi:NADPH2:quinone reductase
VRIAVAAAGVHVVDTSLRAGDAKGSPLALFDLPTIPGREVAGLVDRVGEGVDTRWVGKQVVAHLGMVPGGYASQAVTDVERLHELPSGFDPGAAVAMIGTGRTTLAVLEAAQLTKDDVVLVTAAAGGIGNLLVQLAHNVGAFVVGVAGGAAKVQQVLETGADLAEDYTVRDWPDRVREGLSGREISVAFDAVGGAEGRATLDLLGVGGRFLIYGWNASDGPTQITTEDLIGRGLTVTFAVGARVLRLPGGMRGLEERALAAATSGAVTPRVQRFPLGEAAAAHRAIETRQTTGKVVLVP